MNQRSTFIRVTLAAGAGFLSVVAAALAVSFLFIGCAKNEAPESHSERPLGNQPDSMAELEKPRVIYHDNSQASDGLDATKYFLDFTLHPDDEWIEARQILRLSQIQSHTEIQLDASSQINISALTVNGQTTPIVHDGEVLTLPLSTELQEEPILEIEMQYEIRKPTSGFVFPRSKDGSIAQVWTMSEPLEAREWFISIDRPADKALFETRVRVPQDWKVLSNGTLVSDAQDLKENTYHWLMNSPMPTYLFSLVAGPLVVIEDQWQGREVSYWTMPGMETATLQSLQRTPKMLEMMSNLLIPYPYEKYSVGVAMNFGGAMEHTTATSFSHDLLGDDGKDPNMGEIVALHELAHQWFGDTVTCETWDHLWLNEGFASFFENYYIRTLKGEDAFIDANLRDRVRYIGQESPGGRAGANGALGPIVNFKNSPDQKFNVISYEKGAQVLYMLKDLMGETKFFEGLQLYLRSHFMGTAKTEHLQKALEHVYGKSLEGFFQQWVYRAGYPELKIDVSEVKDRVLSVHVEQTQPQSVGLFQFPLRVQLFDGRKALIFKDLWVAKKSQDFQFEVANDIATLVIDPSKALLAKQNLKMPLSAWKMLLQHRLGTFSHQIEALTELAPAGEVTFEEILQIVEDATRYESLRGQALRVMGENFGKDSRLFDLAKKYMAAGEINPLRVQGAGLLKKAVLTPDQESEIYPALQLLVESDKAWDVAASAAETLVARKAPNAFKALKNAFNPDLENRGYLFSTIVRLFGVLGDERGITLLAEAISHPLAAADSRLELAKGLGAFKTEAAVEQLRLALEREPQRSDYEQWNYAVSLTILNALSDIHLDSAKAILEQVVNKAGMPQTLRDRATKLLAKW